MILQIILFVLILSKVKKMVSINVDFLGYFSLYYFFVYDIKIFIKSYHKVRSSHCDSVVMSVISIHEDVSSIPGPTQWVKDLVLP